MTSMDNHKSNGAEKPARPQRRITARALLEAKRLSEPRLHPDGRHVAFVVTEADFDESRYVSHLWLTEDAAASGAEETLEPTPPVGTEPANAEGQDAENEEEDDRTRQLTFSHDGESRPRWSPDGRFLAFLSARPDESEPLPDDEEDDEPKEQVWILPIEAGEARRLTNAKEGILDFTWTPDSKAILHLAPEPRPRPIESVRKEERNRRKVDPVVEHEERLRRQFWRTDIEERKPKLLFTADYGVHEFAISPDGERIAYTTNYTGEWNDYHRLDLWVRDLVKGTRYKLIQRAGGKYNLRWSPNGYQIAFLSWLDPGLSYSRESLFIAGVPHDAPPDISAEYGPDAPGITDCRMVTDLDFDLTAFEWSPHDDSIYALAAVGTATHVYRIQAETAQLVLGGEEDRGDLSVDPEVGALVFVQESATALEEIFLRDEQGDVRQLTRLNADFGETYRLPSREVIRTKSRDGLEVEAVVIYPLDYQESTQYPLIVQVHGGPKGRATNTILGYTLAPVWSAEGYAVVQPNFRGSEGYGNAFAVANRRDLGGGDFDDIMACVDACIASGVADPDRLGIMGGSYGGYMTNWAIGHTDRFRAAVSMFGIFHLQTDYSNSELSRWDNEYLGAYYWEDPEIYQRLSPGSYIENIKTPTLIIHGDEDNNTFISNSKEMYQALRHRGVTTQFVHYPREGHGLREPNHKLDEVRRALAWMDRYVRHGGENPSGYRIGDKIPGPNGQLELSVVRAEMATFLGQPKPEEGEARTTLLEIIWTLHNRETGEPVAPVTITLNDLRLEPRTTSPSAEPAESLRPVGVPMDVPGGKVLVEGDNLRIAQQPDPETGQLAFAGAAVFRVPASGGDCLLRLGDFPPVAVAWTAEDVEEAEKEETPHEIPT